MILLYVYLGIGVVMNTIAGYRYNKSLGWFIPIRGILYMYFTRLPFYLLLWPLIWLINRAIGKGFGS